MAEYGLHVLNEVGFNTGHEQGVAGQALLDGGGDVTSVLKRLNKNDYQQVFWDYEAGLFSNLFGPSIFLINLQ